MLREEGERGGFVGGEEDGELSLVGEEGGESGWVKEDAPLAGDEEGEREACFGGLGSALVGDSGKGPEAGVWVRSSGGVEGEGGPRDK